MFDIVVVYLYQQKQTTMSNNNVKTGFLNYFVNTEKMNLVISTHKGLVNEIKKFKPKSKTQKGFKTAYASFLRHTEKLDLTQFGFRMELGVEDAFGERQKYYKSEIKDFFWSEIFEAVHFNIVK